MASVFKKFKTAFHGICLGFGDKSIRLQLAISLCVIVFGFFYSFTGAEWLWILSCIFLVVLFEWFNTAIEKICNLIDMKENPQIRIIKDLSAGGVLVAALYAIVIGCLILKGVLR